MMMMKYEVVLWKNPSIGLGITGGKDGENAMHPGDKVRKCIHSILRQSVLYVLGELGKQRKFCI